MPSAYRAQLKEGVVATQGKDGQIAIVPVDTFEEFAREAMEAPRTRDARRQARAMFTVAEQMKLDSQGRILLSAELRAYAGIQSVPEVIVAGVYDHIEIWDPETFDVEDAVSNRQYRDDEEVPGF